MGDERMQYTVEEAISAIGFGKFHAFALAFAGIGWISEAMELMLLSVAGPAIQSEWQVSPSQSSLLDTVVFAGMLVGSYFWGIISDRYGRKKSFLGVSIVTAAAGLASTFSPDYTTLLILRCILGFGVAGGHGFSVWFIEFVPYPNRGTWMMISAAFWTFGTIFEALLAWIVMPRLGWRWLVGLSSLPSFLVILFAGCFPESPRFLLTKSRKVEAQHVLERVAQLNRTKLPLGNLELDPVMDGGDTEHATLEETPLLLPSSIEETTFSTSLALFSPKLLKTTLLSWLSYMACVFGYYGVVFLISELPSAQISCTSIPKLSENRDNTLYTDILINSLAELPGLVFAIITVDKLGRKKTMGIGAVMSLIFFVPLLWSDNKTLTTILLFGVRMFMIASIDTVSIYVKEVYPTSMRSTGTGVASSVGRIGGIICPYVAVGLVRSCHQTAAIFAFQILFAILALSALFLPLEPKGKELRDVARR